VAVDSEIQLINDGDGVAVIGDPTTVQTFLDSAGLPSRDLGLQRLKSALNTGAGVAQAGSEIAANSGRWVKLTEKSAKALKQNTLMKGSERNVSRAVLTKDGKIKGLLEISRTPGAMLTNPAILAGAAGIMAQMAMQQTMDEITDYLAKIDEKVDDVLHALNDAELAKVTGAGFMIEEALTIREHVGLVSGVTWSKMQGTSETIAVAEAYALRRLDALAEKLESKTKVDELAKTSRTVESDARKWLTVLARCFQLQDGISILELDRVLDSSPEDLDRHRLGLNTARKKRQDLILQTTDRLLDRMTAAAERANTKVILHPRLSHDVVDSSNHVATGISEFQEQLGITHDLLELEARPWMDAVVELKDDALETGVQGVDAAKRFGSTALGRARSVTDRLSSTVAERTLRRGGDSDDSDPRD